eukprot:jgi/Chrzof1/6235/Cz17g16220.t1
MAQHIHISRPAANYALITIAKEPVNSFDLDLWFALHEAFKSLEADPSVTGVIFCSGLKKDVFTAGNDLKELYAPNTNLKRYTQFWHAQNGFLSDLYMSRLATVAAIRGACPAGGCCIAMACDERVKTRQGTMGLNEVAIGIPVPKFWAGLMARVIGDAPAERLVLNGILVTPEEADKLGLVDQLVDTEEQLMAAATQRMEALVKLPALARAATKKVLHEEYAMAWKQYSFAVEPIHGWTSISAPETVKVLTAVLKRLSSKGGAASSKL